MCNPIHSYLDRAESYKLPSLMPFLGDDLDQQVAQFQKMMETAKEISEIRDNLRILFNSAAATVDALSSNLEKLAHDLEDCLKTGRDEPESSVFTRIIHVVSHPLATLSSSPFPLLQAELEKLPSPSFPAKAIDEPTPEEQDFFSLQESWKNGLEAEVSSLGKEVIDYKKLGAIIRKVEKISQRALKLSAKIQVLSNRWSDQIHEQAIPLNEKLREQKEGESSKLASVARWLSDPFSTRLPYLKSALAEREMIPLAPPRPKPEGPVIQDAAPRRRTKKTN